MLEDAKYPGSSWVSCCIFDQIFLTEIIAVRLRLYVTPASPVYYICDGYIFVKNIAVEEKNIPPVQGCYLHYRQTLWQKWVKLVLEKDDSFFLAPYYCSQLKKFRLDQFFDANFFVFIVLTTVPSWKSYSVSITLTVSPRSECWCDCFCVLHLHWLVMDVKITTSSSISVRLS